MGPEAGVTTELMRMTVSDGLNNTLYLLLLLGMLDLKDFRLQ